MSFDFNKLFETYRKNEEVIQDLQGVNKQIVYEIVGQMPKLTQDYAVKNATGFMIFVKRAFEEFDPKMYNDRGGIEQ